ncbi:Bax inhibitor-1/YccA family protein [Pedobacter changchengzhani]|uniref:Bax inhibitor-1/YccA family protein n=1 Tax=Pedobacter changchengzhani TaxID=2529274 RepID=A0A4R5MIN2_9SPHI|nr:Bax inhibitor-1/YccA family protein [Pedobacter changchengzhani]TDG35378.1 Bax inhibitor-1/YccA family protein [Pedobacter changchengzhani]
MEQQNYQYQDNSVFVQQNSVAKKFFANVFLWMFVALSLSTLAAFYVSNTDSVLHMLINFETGQRTGLGYVAMFAPLGLVLLMGAGFSRLSYTALLGVFVAFSLLLGVSLSFILLVYTGTSVITCFAAAAGIFGIMAFLGYTTNVDLSKFGPILMVGVVGLVIASIVNMFIQSEQFSLIMAFIGIAVFTALTAYDVQKIKRIGLGLEESGEQMASADTKKLAIMAALSLYLDFINIFLFLLRIFGGRK